MGRNSDKLYITQKEWGQDFGGKKANSRDSFSVNELKGLPFDCCALSLQPFTDPVATENGVVYDVSNILPWIKKHKIDPITGNKLTTKELLPLIFHKNEQGQYHCPITYKVFNDFTHIVAIRTSGNVYSYDAIEELNLKPKIFNDILTDVPFSRNKDIITIQDPKNPERRKLANFHHIKLGIKMTEVSKDPLDNINMSEKRKKMLRDLNKKHNTEAQKKKEKAIADGEDNEYTTVSAQAPGLTASTFQGSTMKLDSRDVITTTDKKGYVRIHTSLGDLNVEIHCDLAPKTCENFLGLCEKGYYNGTIFHRLVPGFMIQGGDPTGTGKGGSSLWGKPIMDEFNKKLQHSARGILSMANAGPNTAGSQFFITFGPCSHLDKKHSVFGKVVGGNETLAKMEVVPVDGEKPLKTITLTKVTVYTNPFKEIDPEVKKEEERKKEEEKREGDRKGQWYSNPVESAPVAVRSGIGKYIGSASVGTKRTAEESGESNSNKKPSIYGSIDY